MVDWRHSRLVGTRELFCYTTRHIYQLNYAIAYIILIGMVTVFFSELQSLLCAIQTVQDRIKVTITD